MSHVFVVDTNQQPLSPVPPARARCLLDKGKAAVFRRYPFTIILKRAIEAPRVPPLRLKIDPGARTTGLALVNDANGEVVWGAELTHRGTAIKQRMDQRRGVRRKRRQRFTRYRKLRFANRNKRQGRLPPSLESRVAAILTWVARLRRWTSLTTLSQEVVRFDLQRMQNPQIQGTQYQHGTLAGYEVREYLLEKWQRTCAYCGARAVPLQVEHIHPRARGGTDRISNLTLACEPCNMAKGVQDLHEFLADQPEVLTRVLAQAQTPLKDAAAVNATRWCLFERLAASGLPLETGSGGLTKYNRSVRGLPKTHWLDAACVGKSTPATLTTRAVVPLLIEATGHGNRQMSGIDKHGFPFRHRQRTKGHLGYQTGDLVRAVVPKGARAGTHIGRVLTRASGSFDIRTPQGRMQGISHRHCKPLHRNDGYSYAKGARHADFPTRSA
ncbi:MAG: RNA-guided endonuclease IscB [Ktedonobacteraceae bacterium]